MRTHCLYQIWLWLCLLMNMWGVCMCVCVFLAWAINSEVCLGSNKVINPLRVDNTSRIITSNDNLASFKFGLGHKLTCWWQSDGSHTDKVSQMEVAVNRRTDQRWHSLCLSHCCLRCLIPGPNMLSLLIRNMEISGAWANHQHRRVLSAHSMCLWAQGRAPYACSSCLHLPCSLSNPLVKGSR